MSIKDERIVIIDCCGLRFSKVIDFWMSEPVIDQMIIVEIYTGQLWGVFVYNIFLAGSESNPFVLDAIFAKSEDEKLFLCLCDCIGDKGWFEKEGACKGVARVEGR